MFRYVLLAAGVALFGYLVHQLGPGAILETLGRIGWAGPILAALYALHQMLRAMALSASVVETRLRWRDALWIRLAGEAVQFLTFTGPFLAEPAKAFLLAGRIRGAVQGFAATLTEYLAYLFTGALFAIGSLAWLLGSERLVGGWRTTAIAIMVGMAGFLATSAWAIGFRIHLLGAALERIARLPGIRRKLRPDMSAVHRTEDLLLDILHDRPKRFAGILALEAGAHVVHALELYAMLVVLGLATGLGTAFLIEGATKFVGLAFFFVPGQIGASEGAHTAIFDMLGLPAVAGFSVPLVRRIRSIIVAGIGLAAMSMLTKGSRHAQ
jgi:hypothetical protein